jgi:hypothetical protein
VTDPDHPAPSRPRRRHVTSAALYQEGEYWTVSYGGLLCRLRDAKGLHYLAHLLRHPDRKFTSAELLRIVRPSTPGQRGAEPEKTDTERARVLVTKQLHGMVNKVRRHRVGPAPSACYNAGVRPWTVDADDIEVADQLRRVNHHLKVFAAVRKEAFAKFDDMTSMVQQYRGSAIDIACTLDSLREIFLNNIRREKDRNLVAPETLRSNPLHAFLGQTTVPNPYTHEEEDVFDYIARHTLRRPRDFMTIGQKLSDLRPQERRVPVQGGRRPGRA